MRAPLADLLRYNAWATRELIEFCQQLAPEQRQSTLAGSFGTIEQTLTHIVGAEEFYGYLLTGERPQAKIPFGGVLALDELLARSERNQYVFERALGGITDADAPAPLKSNEHVVRVGMLFSQLLHHGSEHRGQVRSILGGSGVRAPDISAWAFDGLTED